MFWSSSSSGCPARFGLAPVIAGQDRRRDHQLGLTRAVRFPSSSRGARAHRCVFVVRHHLHNTLLRDLDGHGRVLHRRRLSPRSLRRPRQSGSGWARWSDRPPGHHLREGEIHPAYGEDDEDERGHRPADTPSQPRLRWTRTDVHYSRRHNGAGDLVNADRAKALPAVVRNPRAVPPSSSWNISNRVSERCHSPLQVVLYGRLGDPHHLSDLRQRPLETVHQHDRGPLPRRESRQCLGKGRF